jgi:hypothetical protein
MPDPLDAIRERLGKIRKRAGLIASSNAKGDFDGRSVILAESAEQDVPALLAAVEAVLRACEAPTVANLINGRDDAPSLEIVDARDILQAIASALTEEKTRRSR